MRFSRRAFKEAADCVDQCFPQIDFDQYLPTIDLGPHLAKLDEYKYLSKFYLAGIVVLAAILMISFLYFTVFRTKIDARPRRIYKPDPHAAFRKQRTSFYDHQIFLYAWPSKGGVIVLDADGVDMEFLGLDRFNPPLHRLPDQADEDEFCKRLLLLGAKWFDSVARMNLVDWVKEGWLDRIEEFKKEGYPLPTMKERRFVRVGWPKTGGLWVAEYDVYIIQCEEDFTAPSDTVRLRVARTMDERCMLLRDHFDAKFYRDVTEYDGYADINAWEKRPVENETPRQFVR